MPRTFLIDGSALAYRAFFAPGPGPAFLYASSLISLIDREEPDYAIVAMDTPKPTFRHEAYKEYKATRQKTPEELIKQLPIFEKLAQALGFKVYGLDGWEADDVIGTLALDAEKAGHEVFMVTGDKDFMQLVNEKIKLYNPTRPGSQPVVQGIDAVREKFQCRPDQVIHVLALMGDSSDNIPGVPKVGEKTAIKLIEQFEDLDDIYAHLDDIKPPSVKKRLEEGRELAYQSLDLVTIRSKAPIDFDLEALKYEGPNMSEARSLLIELDFPSLIDRLGKKKSQQVERAEYRVVQDRKGYDQFLADLQSAKEIVFDLETTGLVALEAEIVGLAFSFDDDVAYYLPANLETPIFGQGERSQNARERIEERRSGGGLFEEDDEFLTEGKGTSEEPLIPPKGSDLERFLHDVGPFLESPDVQIIGQNIKYDLLVLGRYGIAPPNASFDTMLASYCLQAQQSQHGLDFLSLKHLGMTKIPTSELIGKGQKQISMWDVPVGKCGEYACEDVDATRQLYRFFSKELDGSTVESVFREIEVPTLRVLERMETHGVLVDAQHLKNLSKEIEGKLETLNGEIQKLAGCEFNIASPKQLAKVLFEDLKVHEELGVKRIKKTKSGFSTDASVLESLSAHPLPAKILDYRQLSKLKSTYADTLPELIHPHTGRIHTSYNQAVASTGRLSSSDPNLQNIPIRTEMGRRIREAFIAAPGHRLLAADYSQVELRLMAHLSGDENLCQAFEEGDDIHRRTASLVFDKTMEEVSSDMRSQAKSINFGIIYGMGAQRLAKQIGIKVKEAQQFIEAYFATFPKVKQWLDQTREQAREDGFVTTLTGRRREVENIDSSDPRLAANARNIAVNTPIQGTAADLIKIAMIRVDQALQKQECQSKMIMQVHDELVFECPEAEIEDIKSLALDLMQGAMSLDVPLVVDVGEGRNWVEAH